MQDRSEPDGRLSASRTRLLEEFIARKISDGPEAHVPLTPAGAPVALCSAQARIWIMEGIYPGTPLYNHSSTLQLAEWIDQAALRMALRVLMDRHDALRLRIFAVNDEPFQQENSDHDVPLAWHDIRGSTADRAQRWATEIAERCARTPFQLDRAPLFRVSAILLPNGKTIIVSVFHHIIVDGWSLGRFGEDLCTLLSGQHLPAGPTITYLDYLARQQVNADDSALVSQLEYWRKKLCGPLPVLDIPRDRPRPTSSLSCEGRLFIFRIPRCAIERAKELAIAEQTTLFVVLLAAFKVLLLRLTGQSDLIIGVPFAARNDATAEQLLGSFVNMVALRTDLDGNPSFREAVRRVRGTTLDAYDNQVVPFDRVVGELKVARDLHHTPIFQVQFALQNMPLSGLSGHEVLDEPDTGTSKFDLTLSLTEMPYGARAAMEYSTALFDDSTARRYASMFASLLEALVGQPNLPVNRHGLISAEEKKRILYGLNTPALQEVRYCTLAEPFEEQAARTPEAIALTGDEGKLTYRELNEQANRLARLLREMGVEQGGLAAVCMERSLSMVVALYAIAKAGAGYVPLDLELPAERIAFMLQDTGPKLVLTHEPARRKVPEGPWRIVVMEETVGAAARHLEVNLGCDQSPHHLAYLMYTSGSTGRPKAVAFPVNAAISSMLWLQRFYPMTPGDGHLLKTPYGFDVSVWEFFWPLYFGATLVVCRPGGHRDPYYLADLIEQHRVVSVNFVPSMLQVFLDQMAPGRCRSLRFVLCGGEALTPHLRDACHAHLAATLVNLYGPTETHAVTDMIVEPNPGNPFVPLGRPSAGFRLYVLDEDLEPRPIGVPGELYIAAEIGLAYGYHRRPDLTADRFLPDPFGPPGARMYRTGDICRYQDNGVLEHLGRRDTQVKLLGMRVELAEIEAVLCEHANVLASALLALDYEAGTRLLAFVVPRQPGSFDAGELTRHAGRLLPRFMIPTSVVAIDRLPTTINGKVDRDALVAHWRVAVARKASDPTSPRGDTEQRLKGIFGRILGLDDLSVTESFFELGGHSLLVFKLITACEQEFGVPLSVREVFSAASVRELAVAIDSAESSMDLCVIPLAPRQGKPILVFIHAAGGSALPFLPLARALETEFSIFALQAPGVDDDRRPFASVEEYAERYVGLLDKIRGHSPVILAGWSFGGNVALEMTRQWRRRHVEIAATILLDSWVPDGREASRLLREETERAVWGIDFLGLEELVLSDVSVTAISRLKYVLNANRGALLRYDPEWFDGEIDLFRAIEPFPSPVGTIPPSYLLPDRGWGSHVRQIVVHQVAGDHFNLIARANAAALADRIRAVVEGRLSFSVV